MCVCMYVRARVPSWKWLFLRVSWKFPQLKRSESFMRKQTLSTVFTSSRQIGKRINTFFSRAAGGHSNELLIERLENEAKREKNVIADPRLSRNPFRRWCTADAPSIICWCKKAELQRGVTAPQAGGWGKAVAGTLECEHFAVTKLHPLKRKLSPATLKYVWESRASQVALAQFFFFRVPWRIFMTVDHAKGDEKSHRSRQSAGMEAANVFPSQISSSYGLFCKAPQIWKHKKNKTKKEQIKWASDGHPRTRVGLCLVDCSKRHRR